jgi:peptide/nickel transport system permease protein
MGDPLHQDLKSAFLAPGERGHILGTDALGRDVLAWVAASIRTGLTVSISVVLVSSFVGVLVGLMSGYAGGGVDVALMRVVDLQLAIPPLLLFIAASVLAGSSMTSLIVLLSVVGWVPYARVVRSKVLAERERSYIAAARLAGSTDLEIVLRHLMPMTASLVIVLATLQAGLVLLWESGLSFLGLGLQPPIVSLGFIIAQGRSYLVQAWWIVTIPGLVIVLFVLAFNMLGDGLRDWFNLDLQVLDR